MTLAPASSTLKRLRRNALICPCIDGKMRTRASCSVLSRSKIQTRRDGGSLASLTLLAADESADALVGEHFEEQRVRYAAVDDVDALNAVARGVVRRADLRQHAAR